MLQQEFNQRRDCREVSLWGAAQCHLAMQWCLLSVGIPPEGVNSQGVEGREGR